MRGDAPRWEPLWLNDWAEGDGCKGAAFRQSQVVRFQADVLLPTQIQTSESARMTPLHREMNLISALCKLAHLCASL